MRDSHLFVIDKKSVTPAKILAPAADVLSKITIVEYRDSLAPIVGVFVAHDGVGSLWNWRSRHDAHRFSRTDGS
jgi:hypothetical protein